MTIKLDRVITWMNVIRDLHDNNSMRHRILENFWSSQLTSKEWLIDMIATYDPRHLKGTVYIFGGWFGILAQLLCDAYPAINVVSVDIDRLTPKYGKLLCRDDDPIEFVVADMKDFTDYNDPCLVINTSTEHILQDTFEQWLSNVPKKTPIWLQGNDYFDCSEHIRCATDIEYFKSINKLDRIMYSDSLDCTEFNRFMTMGYMT